jgi:hypothetical protein
MAEIVDGGRSGWLARTTPLVSAAACGALLAGALMLGLLGTIGGKLAAAVGLTVLPVVPGLLFAHPVLYPAIAAVSGVGLVVGLSRRVGHPTWAGLGSAACGLIGVSGIGVVAASSANVLMMIVHALA